MSYGKVVLCELVVTESVLHKAIVPTLWYSMNLVVGVFVHG